MANLKGSKDLEMSLSSSNGEVESCFAKRLEVAIGGQSVLSFAKKCGFSDSLVRKYLHGTLPGLDKLVVLAEAAGVRAGWLATGELPMRPGELAPGAPSPLGKPGIDMDALEEVAVKVLALLDNRRPNLSAKTRGRIVRLVYEFYIRQEKPMDEVSLNNVIELAAFR